jgi:uncharacterized membrane protein YedE/YeeE
MPAPDALPAIVAGGAFALGIVFGAVAQRANFCTMGAIADIANFGDWRRMRMWALAIAVAIGGTAVLQSTGAIDLSKSLYTGARVAWLSMIVGGFLFGFGMTLGSGCGSRTLIRLGGGNLKSLIALMFLGISAYMTIKGLLAVWRAVALDPARIEFGTATSDLPTLLGAAGVSSAKAWLPWLIATAIAAWALASAQFRRTHEMVAAGVVIGLVIVAGWYLSGHIGHLAEDPATLEEKFVATNTGRMESFSFVAPVAYTLELLIYWTDTSRVLTFGIAGVLGMIVGSAAMALARRTFRWEGFTSTEDLANHVVGGILMGFGGVTALGCTIGQGLSGLSTLAIGSFLAFFAIIGGCLAALRYQTWRIDRQAAEKIDMTIQKGGAEPAVNAAAPLDVSRS